MKKVNVFETAKKYIQTKKENLWNELNEVNENERRLFTFANYLDKNIPKKILSRCNIQISTYGYFVDARITPKFGKQFTEHDTILITAWGAENDKWEFNKDLSSHAGNWNHTLKRSYRNWQFKTGGIYEVTFAATAEIDGCKMVKTVETSERVVYKLECK